MKVNRAEYYKKINEATIESLVTGKRCFVHVYRDGTIEWSVYKEGERLPKDAISIECGETAGLIWEKDTIQAKPEDIRQMVLSSPKVFALPAEWTLIQRASDIQWGPITWLV